MKIRTNNTTTSETTEQSYRSRIAEARTIRVDDFVYDIATGECYGLYIQISYVHEPTEYAPSVSKKSEASYYIANDGTPVPHEGVPPKPNLPAPVIELRPEKSADGIRSSSLPGRRPQSINNPIATALCLLWLEQRATPWLDDIAFGAIHTGPGVINGKQSVSLADVKKLLRSPVLSVASAAECLLNHDQQLMCTRQLQRVVKAARIALRGIALHLEREPSILAALDITIDFSPLWEQQVDALERAGSKEHPLKQRALEMVRSKIAIRTIAKSLGISKNTVKKWSATYSPERSTRLGGSATDR